METLISQKKDSWLVWFLRGLLLLGFLILSGRLAELQLVKGSYFRDLAEGNRIEKIPISAPRGRILARGGETLIGNSQDKRNYPLGSAFAHVGGYLGEVNKTEVGKIDPKCLEKGPLKLGQLVGRSGLEEYYNCRLSGFDGERLIEVDTLAREIRTLGEKQAIAGRDLKTSIDFPLQQKISTLMEGKSGTIIITDNRGEILALYSSPSFSPEEVEKYLNDIGLPLFNRAIAGLYHPGSVFKPLVALAALEEGKIDQNYTFEDTGKITIDSPYGSYSYFNWYFTQYGRTEGKINIVKALARSTDTFFYKLGELLGIDNLVSWANKLGLGQLTDIDLPGEAVSLIPDPTWKQKVKGEAWFLGNTFHLAIGQGDLALTPISLHRLILVLASGGKLCEPKIVGEPKCNKLPLDKDNLDLVIKGMTAACSSGGTGYTFFDWNEESGPSTGSGRVACKTGTAETNEDGKTHAWFTAFNDDIVATVMVEKSGEGSKVAGPIARQIFDFWKLQKNP